MNRFGFSFGIEEEFFLCCSESGALGAGDASSLLHKARRRLGDTVTCEMLESQIELVSPVFNHATEASLVMGQLRSTLAEVVEEAGSSLVAAGTHPFGVWHDQRPSDGERYERLMREFRIVGQRNLVCGLHVHVAVPEDVDRIRVMNRAVRWLPLFLALSTSSPFWNGRPTGLLSYRQTLYDEWPRSGLPDFFDDESDYQAFIARMQSAGAIGDASHLWWAIRPAAKYPTLELRITDACTRVEDSVAIAALFRCLIAALVRDPQLSAQRTTHTRRIVDENRWRAKRDGMHARFIAPASNEAMPAADVLSELLATIRPDVEDLDCGEAVRTAQEILGRGTSAHEQLRIYEARRRAGEAKEAALAAVVEWLAYTTVS